MKFWDFAQPHRLLINYSLRKSSQQFREEIDKYQIEYDQRVKAVEKELKETEKTINQKLESARDAFCKELEDEREDLTVFRENVLSYIEKHQRHSINKLIVKSYKTKRDILRQNISFLSKQTNLINDEISILENRIHQLTVIQFPHLHALFTFLPAAFLPIEHLVTVAAVLYYLIAFQTIFVMVVILITIV